MSFKALEPFFSDHPGRAERLVDGEHFFDILAEDVVTEFLVTVPGYPPRTQGGRPGRALPRIR